MSTKIVVWLPNTLTVSSFLFLLLDSTKPVQAEARGDDIVDDEMEQEEMFVEPHESFAFRVKEWGGPRRGGRLPEPTRFGDWERKGRCTDF
jgi:hypothetical protein